MVQMNVPGYSIITSQDQKAFLPLYARASLEKLKAQLASSQVSRIPNEEKLFSLKMMDGRND